jgi:DNA sulfur modification protein DndC
MPSKPVRASAFNELGFKATIDQLCEEIRELYTADEVPWIIGYSGGKDSTATLQLVWTAVAALPLEARKKPIHVISTDTLVENPVVAAWVAKSPAASVPPPCLPRGRRSTVRGSC